MGLLGRLRAVFGGATQSQVPVQAIDAFEAAAPHLLVRLRWRAWAEDAIVGSALKKDVAAIAAVDALRRGQSAAEAAAIGKVTAVAFDENDAKA